MDPLSINCSTTDQNHLFNTFYLLVLEGLYVIASFEIDFKVTSRYARDLKFYHLHGKHLFWTDPDS